MLVSVSSEWDKQSFDTGTPWRNYNSEWITTIFLAEKQLINVDRWHKSSPPRMGMNPAASKEPSIDCCRIHSLQLFKRVKLRWSVIFTCNSCRLVNNLWQESKVLDGTVSSKRIGSCLSLQTKGCEWNAPILLLLVRLRECSCTMGTLLGFLSESAPCICFLQ